MKRFFLVEANTHYASIFCYELKETATMKYERTPELLFNHVDREKFFGMLNSVCVTEDTLKKADPVKLPAPENPIQLANEPEVSA